MTDDGDLRAVVLGAIQRLEAERDEALARAKAAETKRDEAYGGHDAAVKRVYRWVDQADAALARAMEAERLLSEYRRENGCTRGQRTTQWCAEAARLRVALVAIAEVQPASLVLSAWEEIDRLRNIAKDALEGDKP